MSDEIEDFLRRVAAKRRSRQQQQPPPQPRRQADVEYVAPRRPPLAEPIVEAEIIEAEPVQRSLTSQVDSYMEAGHVTEHSSHLGERAGLADEKLDAHMHDAFDHKLGQLSDTSTQSGDMPSDIDALAKKQPEGVSNLIQILRSPRNLRTAIILSEIMTRPEDRW